MDTKDEIKNWLNSDRDYDMGVSLYNKYGKNLQLKKLFPNRQNRHADKLTYELGKLVGIGVAELAETAQESNAAHNNTNQGEKDTQAGKAIKANKKDGHSTSESYPPIIQRIIAEASGLYKDRGVLKKQQNATPDENTPENMEKRREIIELIEAISQRLEVLYRAKNKYHETLAVPDPNTLWNDGKNKEDQAPESKEDLLKKRNNLRSAITRINNALEYQSSKKEKNPNPLPPCDRRTELEKKLKEKETEIEEINKQLEDATKTEGDSSEDTEE